jgi:hypothetical protein
MQTPNIPETVLNLLETDDETDPQGQSDRIKRRYEAQTPEVRDAIDDIFVSLCGYSLKTIIAGEAS